MRDGYGVLENELGLKIPRNAKFDKLSNLLYNIYTVKERKK
jgi:hypothetical protein